MKRLLILILVFSTLYVLDLTTYVFDGLKGWAFILKSSVYTFKDIIIGLPRCFSHSVTSVKEVPSGTVLGTWNGSVVVKASAKEGDVVVGKSGIFVGFVTLSLRNTVLVSTVLDDRLTLNVEVLSEGGIGIEGVLKGGYPPLVEVPEGIDVTGWGVYISRSEDLGFFLRNMGFGYVGKIVGREGDLFVLEPAKIPTQVLIFGR